MTYYKDNSHADWDLLHASLATIKWHPVFGSEADCLILWRRFEERISRLIYFYVPVKMFDVVQSKECTLA